MVGPLTKCPLFLTIFLLFLALTGCSGISDQAVVEKDQALPAIVFDTDFAGDVDDVGALAILHTMTDAGEADILAVMVSTGEHYAPRAVDTINTYYGRPDIPIGVTWAPAVSIDSNYTADLALDFANDLEAAQNAIDLYRRLLAAQPDKSVTIVSVGFLTNLHGLLASEPDEYSELDGSDLIAAKVVKLVTMGGHYPDSAAHPFGREYNFELDAEAVTAVIDGWPTPIIFSGYEIGEDIITGATLDEMTATDNPVRVAYEIYTDGEGRSSWDLTAVHFAVRGLSDVWEMSGPGSNVVFPDGRNEWDPTTDKQQFYLLNTLPKAQIEDLLDELLIQPPQGQ